MVSSTIKGSEVEPGQMIKSASRWYTVERIDAARDRMAREAIVRDSRGEKGRLLVYVGDDYPMRPAKPPAPKKITPALAARFVAAMVALQECEDCPPGLRGALEDARAEISPWYDR